MTWRESFSVFVVVLIVIVFIALGAEFGVFPIVIIAPIVGVICYLFWRKEQQKKEGRISKNQINNRSKRLYNDFINVTLGLIVIIFILLWFGSCMNGCFRKSPDTPKDLEWKYRIWRQNNP
jgi:uncharacterized membrane protein